MDRLDFNRPSVNHAPLRWLYIDFNSYFASVEQQLRPDLRGRPVAVVPVETDATCAIAASYEAKAYGIRTGTPVHEARRMCPGLVCVLGRHDIYVEYHERIKREINHVIPWTTTESIDEMACRLMRNEREPEVVQRIALAIKRRLAATIGEHIRCSIGIAPNKYLAKVATDLQKPNGLTLLPSESLPGRLLDLKLRDFPGIGANMEVRLLKHGIGTVRELWAKSPAQLRQVWGSLEGERFWYLLRGWEMPERETERRSIGHGHVMAPELRWPPEARHVARRLTMKAASRLRRLGFYASRLTFSARLEDGRQWAAESRCPHAEDTLVFLQLLDGLWKAMLHDTMGARMRKVSVTLHGLVEAGELQQELFIAEQSRHPGEIQRAERLSRAMDKLNTKYGRDTVLIGIRPEDGRSFSGTKIAFTRIPDIEEFRE